MSGCVSIYGGSEGVIELVRTFLQYGECGDMPKLRGSEQMRSNDGF